MIGPMPEGTTQPCPACGIAVMIGYTKCPKCHAPMPGAQRTKRASMAGGTTAERVEPAAAGGGWLWLGAVAAVGIGLVVWGTQCRGGGARPAPAATVEEGGDSPGSAVAPVVVPPPTLSPASPDRPDPSFAADALEGELAGERLYATVQARGEVLDLRSAFCAEARLGELVARHAAELRAAGVVRVRCSEPHGALAFERPL